MSRDTGLLIGRQMKLRRPSFSPDVFNWYQEFVFKYGKLYQADSSGQEVLDEGLRPIACWDVLCVVSVAYCQVNFLQRADPPSRGVIPTVVCLNECDEENLDQAYSHDGR